MNGQELLSQVTSAAIVVYLLQWLKKTKLVTFITVETTTLNRMIAAIGAAIAAFGIHWTYDASVAGGQLVITGLSFSALAHGAWHWANQFALQQLAYDAATSKAVASPPAIKEIA